MMQIGVHIVKFQLEKGCATYSKDRMGSTQRIAPNKDRNIARNPTRIKTCKALKKVVKKL